MLHKLYTRNFSQGALLHLLSIHSNWAIATKLLHYKR